jgi:hypothetical protein
MSDFAPWLADSSLSLAIRKAAWLIPTIQIVHIVAITMIMTSAAMIAARIVGFASQSQSMAQTGRRFLPWIWTGLVLLAPSGVLLIIAEPERTLGNPVFWWKMAFLAIVVRGDVLVPDRVAHRPHALGRTCAKDRRDPRVRRIERAAVGGRARGRAVDRLHVLIAGNAQQE